MRTLLVDNYDSFTYNLFHYLAEVNGEEPVVITNDDPGWRIERLAEFDNVVISPGPGAPGRAADFGVCREIIQSDRVPLLGVCLGHQGIAQLDGARVVHAPEPMHGRESTIEHDQSGLFAGIPSPLRVVRYHSLMVIDLPDTLEATAWTADGILMGLRHRERPLWGVQFHPESIATEHGHTLLANFADLTREWQAANGGSPVRTERTVTAFTRPVRTATRDLRVLVSEAATVCEPEVAFDDLFLGGDHAVWLDSSQTDRPDGRFSIMGDASGPLARVAWADVAAGTVTVRSATDTRVLQTGFFDWLAADLDSITTKVPTLPFDFTLGWVGYLGYELKAECGGELVHQSSEPDATIVFTDRAIVFDHVTSTTYLLALAESDDDTGAQSWMDTTRDRLAELSKVRLGDPGQPALPATVSLRHDRDAYLDLIASCQRDITDGETYEVCLTNQASADADVDAWAGYRMLRRLSPAPFGALLSFGQLSVLSTSPERFIRVFGDRTVESKPIKGTRPRGATEAEDELLRMDLACNEKDRAENLMIVDLVRNDLGRCAEVGTVRAEPIFDVESFATVHQLVSTVRAQLRPDSTAVDCVRAAFPGGSMTGAPKVRTMQIIDKLEAGPRGVYSGGIGYFSLSGAADLSMVIRTVLLTPGRVRYGVGGAIVAMSDPEAEFEETAVKATPLLRLLQAGFPGRVPDLTGQYT
ncbi:MAG: aminodeoxychorismate synthase component I [Actinomycetota bacterium]|nr:aminodeoxychorismate synthase component I [Actinomycetota bacterium]